MRNHQRCDPAESRPAPIISVEQEQRIDVLPYFRYCTELYVCPIYEMEQNLITILDKIEVLVLGYQTVKKADDHDALLRIFETLENTIRVISGDILGGVRVTSSDPRKLEMDRLLNLHFLRMSDLKDRLLGNGRITIEDEWRDLHPRESDDIRTQQAGNYTFYIANLDMLTQIYPEVSPELIIKIRNMLAKGLLPLGMFRQIGQEVALGNKIMCPSARIETELEQFTSWLNEELHSIKKSKGTTKARFKSSFVIAKAIAKLIWIHPFIDGNGRAAFGLATYIRHVSGLRVPQRMSFNQWDMFRDLLDSNPIAAAKLLFGDKFGWGKSRAQRTAPLPVA